jgi:hypothetical protein
MGSAQKRELDYGERLIEFVRRTEFKPATTDAAREEIFRLRYRAYLREGAIEPNAAQIFKDSYDDLPNCWIFGYYLDGRLVSSLRVHVSSPRHPLAPSIPVFRELLGPEVEAGRVIVDPTRFVTDHEMARDLPGLPHATVRLPFLACEHFNADIGIAAVRAEHRAFYKRLFFMDQVAEPRDYPSLTKPIALLRFDYAAVREKVVARHAFMGSTQAERDRLFGRNVTDLAPLRSAPIIPFRPIPERSPIRV